VVEVVVWMKYPGRATSVSGAGAPVRPEGQYVIVVVRPVSGLAISIPLVVQAFAT
jgi:hypothetical protein